MLVLLSYRFKTIISQSVHTALQHTSSWLYQGMKSVFRCDPRPKLSLEDACQKDYKHPTGCSVEETKCDYKHGINTYENHQKSFDSLPWEMTCEILCRLPIKSLGCQRTISKSWNHLTQDPYFTYLHVNYNLHQPQSSFILAERHYSWHRFSDMYLVDMQRYSMEAEKILARCESKCKQLMKVVGTCNGFLCLCDITNTVGTPSIMICNPLTGENIDLPKIDVSLRSDQQMICFGFDAGRKKYEVIWFSGRSDNFSGYSMIIGESCWRKIHLPEVNLMPNTKPVFFNGEFYLIVDEYKGMLVVDICNQTLRVIQFHGISIESEITKCCLIEYEKHLGMLVIDDLDDGMFVETWVLEDNNEEMWVQQSISVLPITQVDVIDSSNVGKDSLMLLHPRGGNTLYAYYPESGDLGPVSISGHIASGISIPNCFDVYPYVPSFVSLNFLGFWGK